MNCLCGTYSMQRELVFYLLLLPIYLINLYRSMGGSYVQYHQLAEGKKHSGLCVGITTPLSDHPGGHVGGGGPWGWGKVTGQCRRSAHSDQPAHFNMIQDLHFNYLY